MVAVGNHHVFMRKGGTLGITWGIIKQRCGRKVWESRSDGSRPWLTVKIRVGLEAINAMV